MFQLLFSGLYSLYQPQVKHDDVTSPALVPSLSDRRVTVSIPGGPGRNRRTLGLLNTICSGGNLAMVAETAAAQTESGELQLFSLLCTRRDTPLTRTTPASAAGVITPADKRRPGRSSCSSQAHGGSQED